MALALTTAVKTILTPTGSVSRSLFEIPLSDLLLFGVFLFVVIPFYHGAVWALVRVFSRESSAKKGGLMIITFAVMLLEALLFYAMAGSINSLLNFIFWFGCVMLLDATWVGLAHASGATNQEAPRAWAIINVGMLVFLVVFWNLPDVSLLPRYVLLFAAAVVRTALDYYFTRRYYLPDLG